MAPVPLIQGAYRARSLIANAQRAVNLYAEQNTQDAEAPVTQYLTPGLRLFASPPNVASARCMFLASNGVLFCAIGPHIYTLSRSRVFTQLGTIATAVGQVHMADNGIELVIVDGSAFGYRINLSTGAFSTIVDAAFYGGSNVDYLDTFLLFAKPNSKTFYSSLSNSVTPFDPLYFSEKVGYPDNIATLITMHREVWLFGTQRATEIWYLEGADSGFPFARLPGAYVEQACLAPASVAKNDLKVFWLGQNQNGAASVFVGANYRSNVISTDAIEYEINKYPVLSDAIGMTYNQQGHDFYMLTFPTADKTWCFDATSNEWHERVWIDSSGHEHRHRANCTASVFGYNLCGDWQNGNIYILDPEVQTDNGDPIIRRRGFPHMVNNGNRISYNSFRADMDCGNLIGALETNPAEISLRWSDDRGHSWGNPVLQSFGSTGQYLVQPQWRQLGMARDRVFELFWTTGAFTALNGAWVDGGGSAT